MNINEDISLLIIKQLLGSITAEEQQVLDDWRHEKIELIPQNNDYKTIVINREDVDDSDDLSFRVIGEFVGVLN